MEYRPETIDGVRSMFDMISLKGKRRFLQEAPEESLAHVPQPLRN